MLALTTLVVLQGARIIHTQQESIPAEAAAIKTMVLVRDDLDTAVQHVPALQAAAAPSAAVAVLLLAGHKVDLRAVAQHMRLPKGSLRLATPEEAVHSTGYELGCIPPLGETSSSARLVGICDYGRILTNKHCWVSAEVFAFNRGYISAGLLC